MRESIAGTLVRRSLILPPSLPPSLPSFLPTHPPNYTNTHAFCHFSLFHASQIRLTHTNTHSFAIPRPARLGLTHTRPCHHQAFLILVIHTTHTTITHTHTLLLRKTYLTSTSTTTKRAAAIDGRNEDKEEGGDTHKGGTGSATRGGFFHPGGEEGRRGLWLGS